MPKFQPGQSGNPYGRRPGTGKIAQLRKKIERDVPEILEALIKAAKDGDMTAAKLLLERVVLAAAKQSEDESGDQMLARAKNKLGRMPADSPMT